MKQYPEFLEFQQLKGTRSKDKKGDSFANLDLEGAMPSDALQKAYEISVTSSEELLGKLKKAPPTFFDQSVVELLVKMGYGGSLADAGKAIGRRSLEFYMPI